jgi:hypothetical protein
METVEDLGRKVKAKYPDRYGNLSDVEAGRRVKDDHPGQYDDFVEVTPVRAEHTPRHSSSLLTPHVFADTQPEPITAGDSQTSYRTLSIVLWVVCGFTVLGACGASSGGGTFGLLIIGVGLAFAASVMWKKANEAYEHEAREISLKTDIKKNQIAYKAEVLRDRQAESEALRNLELASMRQDTSAKQELFNQKAVDLQHHLLDKARERDEDLPTYLAVKQKEAFNKADLDKELTEMRERVRLAIIAEHFSPHQMISLISEQLDALYIKIEEIKESSIPEGAKRRMIEDREEYIAALKGDKREREKRLLEGHNGGDVRGMDEDTHV